MPCRFQPTAAIAVLFAVLLGGCVDGWYANERAYYGQFDARGPRGPTAPDDDDTAADDDDTSANDDDDTAADDDDTSANDDDDATTDDDDDATAADDDDATAADDDDATAADDDDATAADDDDATAADDDDATAADDDDATDPWADDDDATPVDAPDDDDDATPPDAWDTDPNPSGNGDYDLEMTLLAGGLDFGDMDVDAYESRQIEVDNTGGYTLSVDLWIQVNGPGPGFELLGPDEPSMTPYSTEQWMLAFNPQTEGTYTATVIATYQPALGGPPGPWNEVLVFLAEVGDPNAGEANCSDALDEDGDGDIDCDDSDCALAPECGGVDACCDDTTTALGLCGDGLALQCTCTANSDCCGVGWSPMCTAIYTGQCTASTCSE